MFLVTYPDGVPPNASIKVSDDEFESLPSRQGIIPAPYMARHKWVKLDDINRFSKKQWEFYINEAYRLVASKLSLKMQKQLGLLPMAAIKTASAKKSKATILTKHKKN
jgi:predicted DNA-binding protein (MmcQ/YjbR family)